MVVRRAVAILLTIRLVVFLVVRDDVVQRESVVSGHKVDTSPRTPPLMIELAFGRAKPVSEPYTRQFAAPVVPDIIAELVVPFRPTRRKCAHLISSRSAIPRFGNQLHRPQYRILAARLQESTLVVEAVRFARQNRTEI